jgi:hypothetical protein
MTCENAIEFLPWLLNGTLGDEEGREVRRHLETCASCRQALTETREAWQIFDQHVPTAALVAYAWGETPQEMDAERIERHLESCPQCAAELEMAATSRGLEGDDKVALFPGKPRREVSRERRESRGWRAAALAAGLGGVIAASAWFNTAQQLRSVTQTAEKPSAVAPAPAPAQPAQPVEDTGLRERLAELEKRQGELQAEVQQKTDQVAQIQKAMGPQIAWPEDLNNVLVRDGESDPKVAPAAEALSLFFQPGIETKSYPHYELEIVRAGKTIWTSPKASLNKQGGVSLNLPAGYLLRGEYEIRLHGLSGGKRAERVGVYGLRIE